MTSSSSAQLRSGAKSSVIFARSFLSTRSKLTLTPKRRSSWKRWHAQATAEAAFLVDVLQKLGGWRTVEIVGDAAYDFLIEDTVGLVSIQVKMQRRQKGVPLVRGGKFVVETQRTRTGRDPAGGATRPYRFGEFDILAVSLHPSTNDWTTFAYTVGTWLRPRLGDPNLLEVFQPIPVNYNEDWTNSLETCIEWFRSGARRTIASF